ncbi:MAG TPA: DUF222 domain-containing protein [Nocardioidaceae bacterium]|nr:DUF222 domain-containing protein [Nocardioidaceae bacterium]
MTTAITEALAQLENAASAVAAIEWASADAKVTLEAVVQLRAAQSMLDATLVGIAGNLAATKKVEAAGWASAKDFLTAATGGHKGAGPGLVRLAKRLASLPSTAAALREGRITQAKADVIAAKIVTLPRCETTRGKAEVLLLEHAVNLDASELADTWPSVLVEIDPDGDLIGSVLNLKQRDRSAYQERRITFGETRFGGAWMKYESTREEIELVKATLTPLSAPVASDPGACGGDATADDFREKQGTCPDFQCDHDGRDTREHGARMADALAEACRRLQAANVLPESHGATPRLVVTTSLEALKAALVVEQQPHLQWVIEKEIGGLFADGKPLSAAAIRRMACDAEIIPIVLGSESEVLDVGRTKRLVTPGQWTALVHRDRHCAFPGCRRQPIACDAHHVVSWVEGGPTSLDNLVLLCRKHHTMIHETPWKVRINPKDGRPDFLPPPATNGPRPWVRDRPPDLLVA